MILFENIKSFPRFSLDRRARSEAENMHLILPADADATNVAN